MTDVDNMRLALSLAEKGRGRVRDGALVGAVAVRNGHIVGKGYHPESGKSHAEVYALEGVADGTPDVTLYVTLEPCAHTGLTPPCVDLLIKKGVVRVVCGMVDPDRRVSGRGIDRLREAGIRVEVGVLEGEARRLNEAFIKHRTTGFPFVTLKLAQTLDGRIATALGESKWISSDVSRTRAHGLRAEATAVMVGRGTVDADDPALSVRHLDGVDPVKIVLDSRLEISRGAKVFDGAPLILAAAEGVSKKKNRSDGKMRRTRVGLFADKWKALASRRAFPGGQRRNHPYVDRRRGCRGGVRHARPVGRPAGSVYRPRDSG
jgi:diaminohydroxyphosphoribosylaminopyrimidine deaminase/5-amino-6-(5-phosphoribosylamino)uracil reductase